MANSPGQMANSRWIFAHVAVDIAVAAPTSG
jgi:hypothetical protein